MTRDVLMVGFSSSVKHVEADCDWPLFCPAEAPGLHEVHSEEFETLFSKYEQEGRAKKVVKAQKLWYIILDAKIETGGPFLLYKDAADRESFV
jgi:ribonucleoside-diphosphate reductase subunit M1